MPYREKLAWLSLAAMALTFGPYFVLASRADLANRPLPNVGLLWLFAIAALLQGAIQGVGRWWFWRRERVEGVLTLDERDHLIELRSMRAAYFVLLGGMIVVGCMMPFNAGGWKIVNAAVFMIVAAEMVHNGTIVASYRRYA